MNGGGSGFDMLGNGFGVLGTVVPLFLLLVLGIVIFNAARGLGEWSRNNGQPVLTVDARLVAKRTHVAHRNHQGGDISAAGVQAATFYYLTFEVESGDRMEFKVDGTEYGLLAEGDSGRLAFRGTRYLGFQRDRLAQSY